MQRERSRRIIEWQEAIRIAQASEAARLSDYVHLTAAAVANPSTISNPNAMLRSDAAFGSATSCTNAIASISRPGFRDKQHNAHAPRNRQPRASPDSRKPKRLSSLQENASAHSTGNSHDPPPYSKTSDVIAARELNREPSQPAVKSNSVVCYKCGKRGHILSVCNSETKPRRCFACSKFGHISRNCPSHQPQQPQQFRSQSQKPNQKSSNAGESAGVGAPQVFTKAIIDSVHVREALVDTGLAFSMLSNAL